MSENWKQWQGQIVADTFELKEYLGESTNSGDFLATTPEGAKAAIKLVPSEAATAEARPGPLGDWRYSLSSSPVTNCA